MKLTEEHSDVLQNIEFAIVQTWKQYPSMTNYNVMRAYDAAVDYYRAQARGQTPKPVNLGGVEATLWEGIRQTCEWRLGKEARPDQPAPEPVSLDVMVACLRRLRKSVDFWTEQGGRQGYLDYIKQFLT
jgi:hypothetical protein